ncbi:MAG: phosphotransferase [Acidobacteriota bacterium]|nr:phosphotransferase [Acidobacteriota bacterium]
MGESRQDRFSGTKQVTEQHRFEVAPLEAYLAEHVEGFAGPLELRQFKGGQSNPTYRLQTPSRRYVLRRKPPGKLLPSAHAVDREYRVMTALGTTDFPVPKTHCLCTDDSVIGTWFYVMENVEGRVLWEATLPELDRDERAAIYAEMNATLAKLHQVDYRAIGLEEFGKPGNYFARQIHRWTKQYQLSETEEIDAMSRLIDWLPENIPPGDESSIVHGDYRLDNMVFHATEPRIVAVLDWELSTIGHPLGDLSYHCMQWSTAFDGVDLDALGIPGLDEYRHLYCERIGRPAIENWNFYLAYNLFRSAGIAQGIAGRVRDGTAASAWAEEIGASVRPTAERAWALVAP